MWGGNNFRQAQINCSAIISFDHVRGVGITSSIGQEIGWNDSLSAALLAVATIVIPAVDAFFNSQRELSDSAPAWWQSCGPARLRLARVETKPKGDGCKDLPSVHASLSCHHPPPPPPIKLVARFVSSLAFWPSRSLVHSAARCRAIPTRCSLSILAPASLTIDPACNFANCAEILCSFVPPCLLVDNYATCRNRAVV